MVYRKRWTIVVLRKVYFFASFFWCFSNFCKLMPILAPTDKGLLQLTLQKLGMLRLKLEKFGKHLKKLEKNLGKSAILSKLWFFTIFYSTTLHWPNCFNHKLTGMNTVNVFFAINEVGLSLQIDASNPNIFAWRPLNEEKSCFGMFYLTLNWLVCGRVNTVGGANVTSHKS